MRVIFIAFCCILITACVTTHKMTPAIMKARLSHWEALPIDSIQIRLGNPSEIFRTHTDNNYYYVYITRYNQLYPLPKPPAKTSASNLTAQSLESMADTTSSESTSDDATPESMLEIVTPQFITFYSPESNKLGS